MRPSVRLSLALSFSLSASSVLHGQTAAERIIPPDVIRVDRPLLFNEIGLKSVDSSERTGRLVGYTGDSLVYLDGGVSQRLPIDRLSQVWIQEERNINVGANYGMVLGVYLLNVIFEQGDPEGIGAIRSESTGSFALLNGAYLVVGAGVGFLLGSGASGPVEQFTLEGTEEERAHQRERLTQYISGGVMPQRWHLTASGAPYHAEHATAIFDSMASAGWYDQRRSPYSYDPYDDGNLSTLDLLREIRLTWSLRKEIEIGAALEFLDERPLTMFRTRLSFDQTFEGNGFYLLGRYRVPATDAGRVVLTGTAGAGGYLYDHVRTVANIEENRTLARDSNSGFIPAAIFAAGIDIYLHQKLSIGIFADYQFIPAQISPALPEASLAEQKYFGSSAGAGFTVGLHF